MKKVLSTLCLLAMLVGMVAVPAVTAEAATETFYAGYGIANITPLYTVKSVKVSSTEAKANAGTVDKTVSLKVITNPIVFASYGTSESRMGQEYLPGHSYLADGTSSGNSPLYFTKVSGLDSKYDSDKDGRPQYQIVDGDLFTTCIALRYGKNTGDILLLLALDMASASETLVKEIRTRICEAVPGLDPSRIMVSSSHTHSNPSWDSTNENNKAWTENILFPGIVKAAVASINDLSKADIKTTTVCATNANKVGGTIYISEDKNGYINNSDNVSTSIENFNYDSTKKNVDTRLQYMSAVRHYKYQTYACMKCGQSYVRTDAASSNAWSYNYEKAYQKSEGAACSDTSCSGKVTLVTRYYGDSFWTRAEGVVAPTSMVVNVKQAYQDMHIVKFERADPKKDIVLLNWRAHPHRTGSEDGSVLSGDLAGAIRDALSGVRNITTGKYVTGTTRYGGEAVSGLDCLVSYYQGAAGNINETSHDRVNSGYNAWANGTALNDETKSYYYDRDKKVLTNYFTTDYYAQGAVLADIAYDALNKTAWWTDAAEGEINMITSTYTSATTDLSLQITQMGKMAAHSGKSELAKYQYLYNTAVAMRALWSQRTNRTKYKDIQACRRAIIALDSSHVINGIYHANKIYGLLNPYAVGGSFTATSLQNYKNALSTNSEEIDTILIGSQLAIVTAPHELFDTTGQQIEKLGKDLGLSKLKVLNFCYSNGANGYLPNQEAWLYESNIAENDTYAKTYYFSASPYEANTCSYQIGSAEGIVEAARGMLVELTGTERTNHCACEYNSTGYYHNTGHVCDFDAWTKRSTDAASLELTDGYKLQLTGNITITSLQVANGASAMICLNGYTLTLGESINISGTESLAICGCAKSNRGSIVNASGVTSALFTVGTGDLLLHGGVLNGNSRHRVLISTQKTGGTYMFGGEITGGKTTNARYSGNITMQNGEFWLYGGTVSNGNTGWKSDYIDVTNGANYIHGTGGNVHVQNGLFNQYGGTITGGTAALSGGNVFVENGEYNMFGGTVTGGTATPTAAGYSQNEVGAGGNVYLHGGTLTQSGGVISGGTAARCGGNVYTCKGSTFNMYESNRFGRGIIKATVTGGTVTGAGVTAREKAAAAGYTIDNCANGGNVYAAGAVWMYGGEMSGGLAGLNSSGEKTITSGTASGGNIYGKYAVRIGGEVSGGAACNRGNNLYVDSNMVTNLEGAHITDNSNIALAEENVNINDSKTVKLVGDCQIIGGQHAIRIRSVPATLPTEITSETPETGVWLDATVDEDTGELTGSPVFNGEEADIVLVPTTENDEVVNTYLCIYDNFQTAVSNYYYKNGQGVNGETVTVDNRICVLVENASNDTGYQFARKAITYNKVQTESTDGAGNTTTVTTYQFKPSSVKLSDMRYCFKGVDRDQSVALKYDANLGASTPTNPEDVMKQWLVLTACVADVNGTHYTLQGAVDAFASGKGDAVTLLCQVNMSNPVTYSGKRTLVINLDGNDLTADFTMTGGAKLACIDSTTNDYNCHWEGGTKVKYGTLHTNSSDVLEPQYLHNSRRYLRIGEGTNVYSFHRIYMNLTAFGITPSQTGISYSGAFLSNARVRNVLGKNNYGVMATTWYDKNGNGVMDTDEKISESFQTYDRYISTPVKDWSDPGNDPSVFDQTELSSRQIYKRTCITGFLEANPDLGWTSEERANIKLDLVPTVKIGEEYVAVGAKVTRTYKEQIGKANAAWTAGQLNTAQKDALYSMYRKYMDYMANWDDAYISNMADRYHDENSVDKPLDNEQDGNPWE